MAMDQNTRDDVRERAEAAGEHAAERGRQVGEQARYEMRGARDELKHDAREVVRDGRAGAERVVSEQKTRLAHHIHRIGDSMRGASESLETGEFAPARKYGRIAADRIDRTAEYIESREVTELVDDLGRVARKNPEIFLGGAFIAGIAIGRFLRATRPEAGSSYGSDPYDRGYSESYGDTGDIEGIARNSGGTTGNPFRAGDVRDTGPYRRQPMSPDYPGSDIDSPGGRYGRTTVGGYEATPSSPAAGDTGVAAQSARDLRSNAGGVGESISGGGNDLSAKSAEDRREGGTA